MRGRENKGEVSEERMRSKRKEGEEVRKEVEGRLTEMCEERKGE